MNVANGTKPISELDSAHGVIAGKTSELHDRIDELRKRITHITVSRPVAEQASSGTQAIRATRCEELETLYRHTASLDSLVIQMDQLIESIDI